MKRSNMRRRGPAGSKRPGSKWLSRARLTGCIVLASSGIALVMAEAIGLRALGAAALFLGTFGLTQRTRLGASDTVPRAHGQRTSALRTAAIAPQSAAGGPVSSRRTPPSASPSPTGASAPPISITYRKPLGERLRSRPPCQPQGPTVHVLMLDDDESITVRAPTGPVTRDYQKRLQNAVRHAGKELEAHLVELSLRGEQHREVTALAVVVHGDQQALRINSVLTPALEAVLKPMERQYLWLVPAGTKSLKSIRACQSGLDEVSRPLEDDSFWLQGISA